MSLVMMVRAQIRRYSDPQIHELWGIVNAERERRIQAELKSEQARGKNVKP